MIAWGGGMGEGGESCGGTGMASTMGLQAGNAHAIAAINRNPFEQGRTPGSKTTKGEEGRRRKGM